MKKSALALLALATAALGWAAPELHAAKTCTLYAVHAIPGQAIGKASDLAVDITLDGTSVSKGLSFGKFSATLKLDAGSHALKVYEAGRTTTPLIQTTFALAENEKAALGLHVSRAGKAMVTKFTNDLSPIANGCGRFVVHLLTTGGKSQGCVGFEFSSHLYSHGHPKYTMDGLTPGNKGSVEIYPQMGPGFTFEVLEGDEHQATLAEKAYTVLANKVQLIYIVGTAEKGSLAVITKVLPAK